MPAAQHLPQWPLEPLPEIGAQIRRRREQLRLSRTEVATRAGISPRLLAHFEDEPDELTLATLLNIVHALNTSPQRLFVRPAPARRIGSNEDARIRGR